MKRPTNKADMPTVQNLNYKAMHELVLYYLRERLAHEAKAFTYQTPAGAAHAARSSEACI
ncbi:DUF7149 domain-containing protein [Pontibacter akesuensis]|uniref:DUF7149 domain-containing protein n=1 Tax=Pontibacter akesuensis TaxID=388950 RepID=UPI0011134AD0|nr:hypothetical protein [Pontibacter akesuensis]GHA57436.1 hypothetical protein GCM10007389_06420 [Pontibacter akesuensis]